MTTAICHKNGKEMHLLHFVYLECKKRNFILILGKNKNLVDREDKLSVFFQKVLISDFKRRWKVRKKWFDGR